MNPQFETPPESCSCSHLVALTSSGSIDELNDRFIDILKAFSSSNSVEICEDPERFSNSENAFLFKVDLKCGQSIGFEVVGVDLNLSELTLKELADVYINMHHSLERSITDNLTGLFNRQHLNDKMHRVLLGENIDARKQKKARIILLFDIDHFKKVNDTFGHIYGDEVILRVAQIAREQFRTEDWIFRYGGEEFLVILQDIELTEAKAVIERFREAIEQLAFPTVGQITISLGYSRLDYSELEARNIERADKALYFAKQHGRNQAHCYEDLISDGLLTEPTPIEDDIELF